MKFTKLPLMALLVPALILPQTSFAADFVISAQRMPTATEDSTAQVTLLTSEDIEKLNRNTLPEVLSSLASIQVSNGSQIGVRGFNYEQSSSNVLIVLNGRRLNLPDISPVNLDQIPVSQIERIEVLTGNTGVLYGDQAVAAVIIIQTKIADINEVSLNTNSFGATKLAYSNSVGNEENYLTYTLGADRLNEFRDHSAGYRYTGRIDGSKQNEFGSRNWFVNVLDQNQNLPGSLTSAELDADRTQSISDFSNNYQKTTDITAGFNLYHNLASGIEIANEITAMRSVKESIVSFSGAPTTFVGEIEKSSYEYNFRMRGGDETLSWLAGTDLQQSALDYALEYTVRDNTQNRVGIYSQATYVYGDWKIKPGARIEFVNDSLTDQLTYASGQKLNNSANALEIGLLRKIGDNLNISIEAGQNFRFAKIDEQAYTSAGVLGLKPQSGQQISANLNWNAAGNSHQISAYQIITTDEIVFDASAPAPTGGFFPGANVNADQSKRTGLSANSLVQVSESIGLNAGFEYLLAEFISGSNKGNIIPWTSPLTITYGFNQKLTPDLSWGLDGRYESAKYLSGDNSNSLDKIDAQKTINSSINWIKNDWKLGMAITNLLNSDNLSAANSWGAYYPGEPRKFLVSLSKSGF